MKLKVVTEQTVTRIYEVEEESEDALRMQNWYNWFRREDHTFEQSSPEIIRSVWALQESDS